MDTVLARKESRVSKRLDALERAGGNTRKRVNWSTAESRAKEITRRYSSTAYWKDLTKKLLNLYDGMANGAMAAQEMRESARAVAEHMIDRAEVNTNPMYEEYANLRKELRTEKVTLPEEYRKDIQDGYNEVRKKAMGKVLMGNDGTPVDVQYETLHDRYGELFPDDIMNPADQLQRMVDVAESLKKNGVNPFEGTEREQAVQFLADDILERFFAENGAEIEAERTAAEQQIEAALEKVRYSTDEATTSAKRLLKLARGEAALKGLGVEPSGTIDEKVERWKQEKERRTEERTRTKTKEEFKGTEALDKLGVKVAGDVTMGYEMAKSMREWAKAEKQGKRAYRPPAYGLPAPP